MTISFPVPSCSAHMQTTSIPAPREEGVARRIKQPHLSSDVVWYPQRVRVQSSLSKSLFADGCALCTVYTAASPAAAAVAMVIHPDPVCSAVPSLSLYSVSRSLSLSLSLPLLISIWESVPCLVSPYLCIIRVSCAIHSSSTKGISIVSAQAACVLLLCGVCVRKVELTSEPEP